MHQAGPRLREVRLRQGLSLTAVAAKAEVTKGFLSQLERGKTNVSVPTLLAICSALDITIGSLFDYPEQTVVGRGAVLQMGGLGIEEFLLTSGSQRHLQAMRTVLQPGGGSGGAYRLDSEVVFAYVLRGSLEITVDGEPRQVASGESTVYPARSEHEWTNPGGDVAEVLFVFAPPLPSTADARQT